MGFTLEMLDENLGKHSIAMAAVALADEADNVTERIKVGALKTLEVEV